MTMDEREAFRQLIRGFSNTLEGHHRAGRVSFPKAAEAQPLGGQVGMADSASLTMEGTRHASSQPAQVNASAMNDLISLDRVRDELGDCQRCPLSQSRKNIVFGVGDPGADLMFVGEAPGADEDTEGMPFVGKSGQLLDKMIAAMGWSRQSVYIANVLKCRPPDNRDPRADEVDACQPFLAKQIDAIRPKVIVTLGKPAAHLILETKATISSLRGHWHEYRGIRVMPTFHPAYLLRDPRKKKEAWSDLQQVMAECESQGIKAKL